MRKKIRSSAGGWSKTSDRNDQVPGPVGRRLIVLENRGIYSKNPHSRIGLVPKRAVREPVGIGTAQGRP